MLATAHKVTIAQAVVVAAAGGVSSSSVAAAIVAGAFLIINTAVNLAFENRRAARVRAKREIHLFTRKPKRRKRSLVHYYINALTGLVSTVALVLSISSLGDRIKFIQESRQQSATNSCYLWRAAVLYASGSNPRRRARGVSFLGHIGLSNCRAYGYRVRISR